jgi:hypothetical protein
MALNYPVLNPTHINTLYPGQQTGHYTQTSVPFFEQKSTAMCFFFFIL